MLSFIRQYFLPFVMAGWLLFYVPLSAAQTESEGISDRQAVYQLLRGFLLAEQRNYSEAVRIVGEVGVHRRDAEILEAATRLAIEGHDVLLGLHYAELWVKFGGGQLARQMQAELLIINGQPERAEPLLAGLILENAESAADLRAQLSAIPDLEQALAMAKRLFPQTADGQLNLAIFAFAAGDLSLAKTAVAAAERDSGQPEIIFLKARIAGKENGSVAALPVLEQYVADHCRAVVTHCQLESILWSFGAHLRGEENWLQPLNTNPPAISDWLISAGNWFEQWQMPSRARDVYQRAGNAFGARLGLARLLVTEENLSAALTLLLATEAATENEFILRETTIADLLDRIGQTAEAEARLESARRTVPGSFNLMYQLSMLHEKKGDLDKTLKILHRIIELHPNKPDGWNALGYVMADHNIDLPAARRYIERAIHLMPEDPNIIDSLGWVYYRLGDLSRARMYLEKAAALSSAAEIAAHLGEVLWEIGDFGEARRVWQDALARHSDNAVLNETIKRYQPF